MPEETHPTDEKPKVVNEGQKDDSRLMDVHNRMVKRINSAIESTVDKDNREQSNEDVTFANTTGGMWEDGGYDTWHGRPKFEVNQIQPMINVVVGDQRESDLGCKILPAGDGGTKQIADTFNGLIRNIQNISNFDDIRDSAFKEVCDCGFGGWYVTTEWNVADPWVQDIKIKPIRSAINMVWFDPGATGEVAEDADWCVVGEEMTDEDFKQRYPDAQESDFPQDYSDLNSWRSYWYNDNKTRVADYWEKVRVTKTIGLFTKEQFNEDTGEVESEEKTWEIDKKTKKILDEAAGDGWVLQRERDMDHWEVKMYKVNGSQVLEGPYDWPGQFIPVVPVYGYQRWISGSRTYWGMVRFAKDVSRIYNYAWSSVIHALSKAPKDPWILTRKHLENPDDQRAWEESPLNDDPFLFVTPDPEFGAPVRQGAPAVPAAMLTVLQEATQNIQRVTGKFASSQGDNPMDQSGRAVMALQRQGDLGTFTLIDNLAKSIRRTGEILVDLIPRIYDTDRQLRIIDPDGTTRNIRTLAKDTPEEDRKLVNTEFVDRQTGENVLMIDLNQGRYDVTESVAPAYASRRQEFRDQLANLSAQNPQLGALVADMVVGTADFEGSEAVTKRIRRFQIQNKLDDPTDEEIKEQEEKIAKQGPPQPSPMEQMQQQLAQLELEAKDLENEGKKAEIQLKMVEIQDKMSELQAKQQSAPMKAAAEAEEAIASVENTEADTEKKRSETAKNMSDIRLSNRETQTTTPNQ